MLLNYRATGKKEKSRPQRPTQHEKPANTLMALTLKITYQMGQVSSAASASNPPALAASLLPRPPPSSSAFASFEDILMSFLVSPTPAALSLSLADEGGLTPEQSVSRCKLQRSTRTCFPHTGHVVTFPESRLALRLKVGGEGRGLTSLAPTKLALVSVFCRARLSPC